MSSTVSAARDQSLSSTAEPSVITPFCFMWAATQLLDLFCFPDWVLEPTGIVLFISTVAVLVKPSASGRFLVLCVLNLVYLYVRSPITPNHVLFEGFVNLTICWVVWRNRRIRPERAFRSAVYAEAAPILQLLLCGLYFFAVLHKLNWDFLTPATSCAGFMLDGLASQIPLIPTGTLMKTSSVWGTLLVESSIPLLLVFPRTRRFAMLLAWAFHLMLSFHPRPGIPAFSSMILALLTLWLPVGFYEHLAHRPLVESLRSAVARHRVGLGRFVVVAGIIGAAAAVSITVTGVEIYGADLSAWPRLVGLILWVPYALAFPVALWIGWPPQLAIGWPGLFRNIAKTPALVLVLLFSLNCLAPYFGFQTLRTLSMFSSVRTEAGRTNHLFIPRSLQIADYQDDVVRIVSSSDIWLDYYADDSTLITYIELRRRAWEDPDQPVQLSFERDGRIYHVDTSDPEVASWFPPVPFPLHKILAFRLIDREGPANCRW